MSADTLTDAEARALRKVETVWNPHLSISEEISLSRKRFIVGSYLSGFYATPAGRVALARHESEARA